MGSAPSVAPVPPALRVLMFSPTPIIKVTKFPGTKGVKAVSARLTRVRALLLPLLIPSGSAAIIVPWLVGCTTERLQYLSCSVPSIEQPFVHGIGGIFGSLNCL